MKLGGWLEVEGLSWSSHEKNCDHRWSRRMQASKGED